jgi:GntR family transcriptional regulator
MRSLGRSGTVHRMQDDHGSVPYPFRPDEPRHVQIATALRDRIRTGEIQPRMPLPSELRLQQEFGVARDTVRKAITVMRDEGYVRTVRGLGTFVCDKTEWPVLPAY